jgi:hypothetical protein
MIGKAMESGDKNGQDWIRNVNRYSDAIRAITWLAIEKNIHPTPKSAQVSLEEHLEQCIAQVNEANQLENADRQDDAQCQYYQAIKK